VTTTQWSLSRRYLDLKHNVGWQRSRGRSVVHGVAVRVVAALDVLTARDVDDKHDVVALMYDLGWVRFYIPDISTLECLVKMS
jgi:hypothetical protein